MAIRHMEGFRKYVASGDMKAKMERVYATAHGTINYAAGRYVASGGVQFTGGGGGEDIYWSLALDATGVTKFIHGFCIKSYGSGTLTPVQYLSVGGTGGLVIDNSGVSMNGTAKGDFGLNDGTWHHVEWVQYASGTDALYIDGALAATQASTAFGTSVRWLQDDEDAANYQISDWYILDDTGGVNTGRLGDDARVETLFPNGDDELQEWSVVGAASAAAVLDNVPEVFSQYVATNANDKSLQLTFGNMSGIADVAGIQASVLAQNQDSGDLRSLTFLHDGAEVGTPWQPGTTLGVNTEIFDENPDTSAAWTESDVNGLVAGIKSKA